MKFGEVSLDLKRGEKGFVRVPYSELADGTPLSIPLHVIRGAQEGPTFVVVACIHGNEVTGTMIALETVKAVNPKELSGELLIVPAVNIPSYLTRSRGFALEERGPQNMQGAFPGNKNGFLTQRVAYTFYHEIALKANYIIDLHNALNGSKIYPFTYLLPNDDLGGTLEVRKRMCRASGLPMTYVLTREAYNNFISGPGNFDRSLGVCDQHGIAKIMVELGEGNRISEDYLEMGVRSIMNNLKELEMLPGKPEGIDQDPIEFTGYETVHAPCGGLVQNKIPIGTDVRKGELVAKIHSLSGHEEEILAPVDGRVIRLITRPNIYPGAEVIWIVPL